MSARSGVRPPAPRASSSSAVSEDDDAPRVAEGHLSADPVPPRRLGLLLTVGGVIGFLAAFTLTVERIKLLLDPTGYTPSCDINPFISCGSVMVTWQARLFGFPNPLIGIAAFAVATTLGVLLLSGTPLPRWVRAGWQVGITLGFVFICWLMTQSLYSIKALCPWCMVAWAVVIPMFWTTTVDSLDRGTIPVPRGARRAVAALVEYRLLLTVLTDLLVVVLIAQAFWDQWVALV
ncbi:vitamin K epoxide reductase family protein [Quadrisphaera setariae]|uniref:Vitamin K epoxide reductase family protein n=1 Tax=Quadrisphaera setariae TaxID=2593304 RepID=A0A5C8ZED8_9ACTN|nr:vitamin K epoxide reductase family protein [Quadrisphaera setariae]TXR55150.1 vitamin K epoxide reductase family protein [Quadrisphaera setariae]